MKEDYKEQNFDEQKGTTNKIKSHDGRLVILEPETHSNSDELHCQQMH